MSFKLSKSKVNCYLKCPREFKYQYIEEIERGENEYLKIGAEVHKIAEKFIKEWEKDKSIPILETLLQFEREYEENYQDHCINLSNFFKLMLIDKEYDLFHAEKFLYSEKYDFSGLADIVLKKNNKLLVIDYKTGKTHGVKQYITELCYYKMLIEDCYPNEEVKSAGIFFTKQGDLRELKFDDNYGTSNCSSIEYYNKIELLKEVRKNIELEHFEPKRQFLCKYCDYKQLCDREGF